MSRNQKLYNRAFNWEDLPIEEVRLGVRRRAYATDQCMLVMNYIEPQMQVNPHVHDDFDQLVYIVSGRAIYHVGDKEHVLNSGSLLLVPAGKSHYIEPINGPVENLDIFCPPRSDLLYLLTYLDEISSDVEV